MTVSGTITIDAVFSKAWNETRKDFLWDYFLTSIMLSVLSNIKYFYTCVPLLVLDLTLPTLHLRKYETKMEGELLIL